MKDYELDLANTGLEVVDLIDNAAFAARQLHTRDITTQVEGLRHLTQAFVTDPDHILDALVSAAIDLCGADSAGVSLERENRTDENYYEWVATAGQYQVFVDALLPRHPSACSVCLDRNRPQLLRVSQLFFDIMKIDAPLVTDGILLPWQAEGQRGTIWILAHGRTEAFDSEDLRMMQIFADFCALALRHKRQQNALLQHTIAVTASSVAEDLAHQIKNPVESLTNLALIGSMSDSPEAKSLAGSMSSHIDRLSSLVNKRRTRRTNSSHLN